MAVACVLSQLPGYAGAAAADSVRGFSRDIMSKLNSQNLTALAESLRNQLAGPFAGKLKLLELAERIRHELPSSISSTCAKQLGYMLQNLDSLFALQMLDSFGKPSAGLLTGNLNWMGDFDECVNANTGSDASVVFSGQYCKLLLPFHFIGQSWTLQLGTCVPSGCSSTDTSAVYETVSRAMGHANLTGLSADCHPLTRQLDAKAWVAIAVLSILGGLLSIGTILDVIEAVRTSIQNSSQSSLTEHDAPNCLDSIQLESRDKEHEYLQHKNQHSSQINLEPKSKGFARKLITSFSCYKNGRKLLDAEQSQRDLSFVNGIRFFTISWIALCHTNYYNFEIMGHIFFTFRNTYFSRIFHPVYLTSFSIDTMFVLSGFLAAYHFLKELERKNGELKARDWIIVYFHRYIRLTSAYAVILMVWTCLVNYFADGPGWPTGPIDACYRGWWTNLLYINNIVSISDKPGDMCMGHTWYLSNDMQFFAITPMLAFLFYKHRKVGVAAVLLLVSVSVLTAGTITSVRSYGMGLKATSQSSWFKEMYIKPWCLFDSYGVGVLLGFILHKYGGEVKLTKMSAAAGWLVAAACSLAVLYGPYDAQFGSRAATATVAEAAAFNSLSRLTWSLCLAWLIFACHSGYAGWINTMLSWKAFTPLARLSYCTYLIHPIVMELTAAASRNLVHLDGLLVVPHFLGMLGTSLALAFIASLAVEAPALGIEKTLLNTGKEK